MLIFFVIELFGCGVYNGEVIEVNGLGSNYKYGEGDVAMLRQSNYFIVFAMMLATLLGGCKPKVKTPTKKLLLLESRLERTHSGKTEAVSKIRFVAGSDASTSVFLPCGDEWGIGIAFVPEISKEGQVVLSIATYTERFYAEDILGEHIEEWPSRYAEGTGGGYTSFRANMGEDIVFVQGSRGRNLINVSYKVIVNCERTVDPSNMKHIESSLFELDGERLHQINVAIPEIMSAGVEIGANSP